MLKHFEENVISVINGLNIIRIKYMDRIRSESFILREKELYTNEQLTEFSRAQRGYKLF